MPTLPPISTEPPLRPLLPPDYGDGYGIPDYDSRECPRPALTATLLCLLSSSGWAFPPRLPVPDSALLPPPFLTPHVQPFFLHPVGSSPSGSVPLPRCGLSKPINPSSPGPSSALMTHLLLVTGASCHSGHRTPCPTACPAHRTFRQPEPSCWATLPTFLGSSSPT